MSGTYPPLAKESHVALDLLEELLGVSSGLVLGHDHVCRLDLEEDEPGKSQSLPDTKERHELTSRCSPTSDTSA